jgi:hypothetical protein
VELQGTLAYLVLPAKAELAVILASLGSPGLILAILASPGTAALAGLQVLQESLGHLAFPASAEPLVLKVLREIAVFPGLLAKAAQAASRRLLLVLLERPGILELLASAERMALLGLLELLALLALLGLAAIPVLLASAVSAVLFTMFITTASAQPLP